ETRVEIRTACAAAIQVVLIFDGIVSEYQLLAQRIGKNKCDASVGRPLYVKDVSSCRILQYTRQTRAAVDDNMPHFDLSFGQRVQFLRWLRGQQYLRPRLLKKKIARDRHSIPPGRGRQLVGVFPIAHPSQEQPAAPGIVPNGAGIIVRTVI